MLALDAMVIAKSAPRPDLAHQFINFMLEGRNSADLTNMIGSGNPNKEALQYIKPEIKPIKAVFPDAESCQALEMLKDLNRQATRVAQPDLDRDQAEVDAARGLPASNRGTSDSGNPSIPDAAARPPPTNCRAMLQRRPCARGARRLTCRPRARA